jgi:DNA-binding transcriptional regulator GbsR (MarR family)
MGAAVASRGERTDARAWVEDLAMALERDGLPRMAGRIFGWLLVCDPPEQTLEDLAAALHGSKASMSTMTRLLARAGLVERMRPPGTRRDHYRIRSGQWEALWRSRLEMIGQVMSLLERGRDLVARRRPEARRRLEELHEQYAWFGRELPRLLARWALRSAPRGATRTSRDRGRPRS